MRRMNGLWRGMSAHVSVHGPDWNWCMKATGHGFL